MKELLSQLLSSLPSKPTAGSNLRHAFVGATLEPEQLEKSGWTEADSPFPSYAVHHRRFSKDVHRVALLLSPEGVLMDLRLARHLDLTEEDFRNPCGWFDWETLPDGAEGKLAKRIAESVTKPLPADPRAEIDAILDRSPEISADERAAFGPDYLLCSLAYELLDSDRPRVNLATVTLSRWADIINDPRVLGDLPWLCGKVSLPAECARAFRVFIDRVGDSSAEGISNLGASLCDCLDLPDEAFQCFQQAIGMKPELIPPRQSLAVAAKTMFQKAASGGKFGGHADAFRFVLDEGHLDGQGHAFWSTAAVAFESDGAPEEALRALGEALEHEPACDDCNAAMRRLSGTSDEQEQGSLRTQQQKIQRAFEYRALEPASL